MQSHKNEQGHSAKIESTQKIHAMLSAFIETPILLWHLRCIYSYTAHSVNSKSHLRQVLNN